MSQTEREMKAMDEGVWEYGGMTSLLEQRDWHLLEIRVCLSTNVIKCQQSAKWYHLSTRGQGRKSAWFDHSCRIIVWRTDTCQCITIRNAALLWATLTCHIKLIKQPYNIDQWLMTVVVATSKDTLLQILQDLPLEGSDSWLNPSQVPSCRSSSTQCLVHTVPFTKYSNTSWR